MRSLFATVAIAALAVGTAQAQGKGNGGGQGGANEHAGHAMANPKADPGQNRGGQPDAVKGKSETAPRSVARDEENPGQAQTKEDMPDRAAAPAQSREHRNSRAESHGNGKDDHASADVGHPGNGDGRDVAVVVNRNGNTVDRIAWQGLDSRHAQGGLIAGCPPGLAKKNNGCMPPGQESKNAEWRMTSDWWGLRTLRDLSGYSYYSGSMVRYGPSGSIIGYVPLLGGALAVGNPWPGSYAPTTLDPYFVNYYGLGDDYRYYDRALYRIDPQTQAITAIAGLLTGDDFRVGSPMPSGYEVYNVPYAYRDRYADGPDATYRYSDGYVYQVDPKTQLIVSAIQLLI